MITRQIEKGEALTASEAILKFGLNWLVGKKKHGIEAPNSEEHVAIFRQDTGHIFQFAKQGYEPLQNTELFEQCDELTKTGQAKYVAGGSYKQGAIVWLRVAVPGGDFEVTQGDKHKAYLNIVTSHDGSKRFMFYPEVYRQICSNGMHAWVRDKERTVSAKHTKNMRSIIAGRAQEVLAKELEYFRTFADASRKLASKQMTELQIESFLYNLFNVTKGDIESEEKNTGKVESAIEKVKELCFAGTGIREYNLQGTAYGVYNAVTEYIGKYRPTRGDAENREISEAFGSGKDLREKAFEELLKV